MNTLKRLWTGLKYTISDSLFADSALYKFLALVFGGLALFFVLCVLVFGYGAVALLDLPIGVGFQDRLAYGFKGMGLLCAALAIINITHAFIATWIKNIPDEEYIPDEE